LRKIAIQKGWKLNEYGLFDKNNKMIAGKDEKEVYNKLGFKYIPPEKRKNEREFEEYKL
jgi:DNA polymerase (family 10)